MEKTDFQDLIVLLKEKKAPALARFKAIAAEYEELKLYLEKIDNMLGQCGYVEEQTEVVADVEVEAVEVDNGEFTY